MPSRLALPIRLSRSLVATSAAMLLVFCGPASPQSPAPVQSSGPMMESAACVVRADTGAPVHADTVRIALTEPVHLAAQPVPATDAERLVFRQMFENLVRVDCEGHLAPGAALSWRTEDSGSSWTVILADSIRTWAGRPVRAADVVAGWSGRMDPNFMSVVALGERTLRIFLARAVSEPRFLTDPRLSLTPFGMGTGRYRPDSAAAPGHLRLIPADSGLPVLDYFTATGDPRDQLDRGADLLVSSDPSLIEYAEGGGDRTAVPLPWNRTYSLVLTQPAESLPPALAALTDSLRAADFRRLLARDAVRAESRESGTSTGIPARSCSAATGSARPTDRGRVYYLLGDQTSQDLAERLVALVPRRYGWRASGVAPDAMNAALRDGRGASLIMMGSYPGGPACAGLGAATALLPLVDTRAHAILRRSSPAWVVDGDGTLRMPVPGTIAP